MPKLAIDIEARFAQAMDALDKLGGKADQQARRIETSFKGVSAAIGSYLSFRAIEGLLESIAGYQDLADQVGDTAEAMASLQAASDLSGVSLDEVARASARMTSTFAKGGQEAQDSAAALAAINIQFEEFKRLSPVEQMERVALELAKFEDGAGKTAVAIQLFGRAGAQLIPFFNDLAEAGGRNARLTAEQIKAADDFSKELARLRTELGLVGQTLLADVVPPLTKFLELMRSGINPLDTLIWQQFPEFSRSSLARQLKNAEEALDKLQNPKDWGQKNPIDSLLESIGGKTKEDRIRETTESIAQLQLKLQALSTFRPPKNELLPALDDPLSGVKGRNLNFTVPETPKKGAKDRETEAEKITKWLEQQVQSQEKFNLLEQTAIKIEEARTQLIKEKKTDELAVLDVIEEQLLAQARMAVETEKIRKAAEERAEFEAFLAQLLDNQQAKTEALAESYRDLIDPVEQYRKKLREITELQELGQERGGLNENEANLAREAVLGQMSKLEEASKQPLDEMSVYAEQAARNIQDAFADFLFDPFEDGVDGMFANFERVLRRMAAEALASQVLNFIKGWAAGAMGGAGSSTNTTGTTLRAIEGGSDAVYGAAVKSDASPQVTVNVQGSGPQLTEAEFARVVKQSVRNGMRDAQRRNG